MHQLDRSIGTIAAAQTPQDIRNALGFETARLGFEWFAYDILVMPDGSGGFLVGTNYPKAWIDHYIGQRYTRADVVVSHAMRSVLPAQWGDMSRHPHLTEPQKAIIDEAAEVGLTAGAVIPIHGPGQAKSLLVVSSNLSSENFARLFQSARHELQIIAAHAHERLIDLGVARPGATLALSPREMEVLTWTALGESAQAISDRLKISHHTVNQYLENAKTKLGARNKTHAVSIAISQGIVRL
jgi:DNA-binding CsgD family transcriptional regulator